MKRLLFFLGIFSISTCLINAQDRNWGVGLRMGAFTQAAALSKKDISDQNRNIQSGLYYQAFVNKQFGLKQHWMLEANFGYNSFSSERSESYYSVVTQKDVYIYSFAQTHIYSLQMNLRYAFWRIPDLRWRHYAGVSIAIHKSVEYTNGISSINGVVTYGKSGIIFYHNFLGPEYFGKIQMNKRLSVQYLFGYNFSSQAFMPYGRDVEDKPYRYIYNGPTIHRFNFNFGFGYQL